MQPHCGEWYFASYRFSGKSKHNGHFRSPTSFDPAGRSPPQREPPYSNTIGAMNRYPWRLWREKWSPAASWPTKWRSWWIGFGTAGMPYANLDDGPGEQSHPLVPAMHAEFYTSMRVGNAGTTPERAASPAGS